MTANENRPGVASEAAPKDSAGELNSSTLMATSDIGDDVANAFTQPHADYGHRIRISDRAESYLEGLAADLVLGLARLDQLSPALLQFWEFAFQQGRTSRTDEVAQLEHDLERMYFEVTIRQPKPRGEYKSWADLQRIRKEREVAAAGHYPGGDLYAAWGVDHD